LKAVILAAGVGKRLGELTRNTPKPMVPICGRPVLSFIIDRIMSAGVCDFVLVTKYLPERIVEYFGDGTSIGARISYAPQGDDYGTGAALLSAADCVAGEPVMMTYGDILTSASNYSSVLRLYNEGDCSGVVSLNWMDDPSAGGAVVLTDDECVERIVEKPRQGEAPSRWNNAGLFIFEPVMFDYLKKLKPSPRGEYELPDAINEMARDGYRFKTHKIDGAWQDVGTKEDLQKAEEILRLEGDL
jgi:UDP-N-acetylglucosamine diphosphorylase / glucose-1-phosphate thymidylyltransferase / UDP-N-acetylgalactosamine diphosphorylase / glucosamine-1-phosphate N-acetyltransferase / galactosamine-1-phosphate N-acetyltransferase